MAEKEQAVPFDVPGVELGHKDGQGSFDTIVAGHGVIPTTTRIRLTGSKRMRLCMPGVVSGFLAESN